MSCLQPSETFNNFSFKLNAAEFLLSNVCVVRINNRNIEVNPDNLLEIARNNENILRVTVGGHAPCFERAPIRGSHADPNFNLHEWVLAGWGTPIGQAFDLEKLSQHCKATERYSFSLSSMPLKVIGGVASPPNAFGIF